MVVGHENGEDMRSRSTRDTSLGLRKVDAIGANHSRSRYGRAANGTSAGLLCEETPETPVLRSRELKVFGAIEVAHLRLLPGEVETPPFKGHLVNVHLGAPHRLVQRRNERTHEGLKATGAVDIVTAGTPAYWCMAAASEDMSMLLEDRFIQRVTVEADADPDKIEIVPFFSARDPQIERIGLALLSEMETGGLGGELCAESLANVLALHLLRQHSSLGGGSGRKSEQKGGFSKRSLERATDYINDNLSQKLTLTEIAGAAQVSPYHLARLFKAAIGLSPHQYVVHQRVEQAKTLLVCTDLSIVDVAGAVGFANQSHLAFHVRRLLGVSPKALRQSPRH
ncbi:MAG: AraC family transcriptional regulator [Actinomycetota bacterium]|jgi:AraC family transcriptional regulator|nr:AraC family transcriptional regulator [Actinomycetota bacterium]